MLHTLKDGRKICGICGYECTDRLLDKYMASFCPNCGQDLKYKSIHISHISVKSWIEFHKRCIVNLDAVKKENFTSSNFVANKGKKVKQKKKQMPKVLLNNKERKQ